MHIIKSVTIFGSAVGKGGDHDFNQAFLAAKKLAENGIRVVDGGGPGVMFAGIRGAQEAGGKTTAVYLEPDYATAIQGREASVIADEMFSEKNYVDRTQRLMELGDAYVFFNGGRARFRSLQCAGLWQGCTSDFTNPLFFLVHSGKISSSRSYKTCVFVLKRFVF